MSDGNYGKSVFINCPFDGEFELLLRAIVFAILDCGYIPRCAREEDDSGNVRMSKILHMIDESRFGIHDLSRTDLDPVSELPRFNMPLELGIFLGAKYFGVKKQRDKICLITDTEKYRYQKYVSDIAGQDPRAHQNDPKLMIISIRNWLNSATKNRIIPGGKKIGNRFELFTNELPIMCTKAHLTEDEMTYNDFADFAAAWIKANDIITKPKF